MKLFTMLAIALVSAITANAQLKEIEKSEIFEEPRNGFVKIIHDDAGDTYFVHVGNDGLMLKKYDTNHKLVKSKKIKSKLGNLHLGKLLSITCRDNAILVFTSELENRTPALYRQVIDATSLDLREENQIDSMPKIKIKVKFGKVSERELNRKFDFYVKTDAATGSYAVAAYYTDEETNKQVRVTHYNNQHKVISSSGFFRPDSDYSYYDYRDLYVNGEQALVAMAIGSKRKTGDLLIGVLPAGANAFEVKEVDFPQAKDVKSALITFNPTTNQYMAVSISENAGNTVSSRTIWNPQNNEAKTETITGAALIKAGKAGKGSMLKPVVQQLLLQADGSYTLIFEDMKHDLSQYSTFNSMSGGSFGSGGNTMMKTKTSNKFYLNNLAVVHYDANGNLLNSDVLQKSFQVTYPIQLNYMNAIQEAGVTLTWGLQFKTFYYVNGKTKKYIIFNDDEKNQERINSNKKPETIVGLENCEAYMLALHKNEEPQRKPLFTEPTSKTNRQLVVAAASSYNPATNEVAILKVNYKDKKARIVWMQAE